MGGPFMPAGRPRKQVDEKQIEMLAGFGCTVAEIAGALGVSKDTLERNYAARIEKGREQAKISLRRMQFKSAEAGNVTMQIWLGKQLLGQKDHNVQEHAGIVGLQLVHSVPQPQREE
jgi:transcriptional regulator with XRE-family HTH domain